MVSIKASYKVSKKIFECVHFDAKLNGNLPKPLGNFTIVYMFQEAFNEKNMGRDEKLWNQI